MNKKNKILKVVASCLTGFVNGFFGSGGGILCVLSLKKFYGLKTKNAHATTVAIIFPLCIVSSVVYALGNSSQFNSKMFVSLGVVLGGILGALTLKRIKSEIVSWIFIVLLFISGTQMIIS